MLTPILNALRPREFLLVNEESRATIKHFADVSHGGKLREYPRANASGWDVIEALGPHLHQHHLPNARDSDLFDLFSYWLVMVKEFDLRPIRHWKLAPGDNAWNWRACRQGRFVAIGWDLFGDLSCMDDAEFENRVQALDTDAPDEGWYRWSAGQVWRFANEIQEGDRIAACRGTREVLGLATVVGAYYFVPGARHGHRLPVRWDDLMPRQVREGGRKRALGYLDEDEFERITNAPTAYRDQEMAAPFSRIFLDREEAEWAFDVLKETLGLLGVIDVSDERFSLALADDEPVLRLSFGEWWTVLRFAGPDFSKNRVAMALIQEEAELTGLCSDLKPLDGTEHQRPIRVYRFPMDTVRPLTGRLRRAYENTFAYMAERFANLEDTKYRKHHVPAIAKAVFDRQERCELLTGAIGHD
ncbi:MAG: hypothetical protein ACOC8C_02415 [Chloroflexota bacterium]